MTELIVLLINHNQKLKELKEANDDATISIVKGNNAMDNNISKLIKLSSASKQSSKELSERARIISDITSINGNLGDSIAEIYEKEKDQTVIVEKLNKLREEQNKLSQLQIFLNQEILDSADGGSTTVKDDIVELEKAQNRLLVAVDNFNNKWIVYEQSLRDAIQSGSFEGKKLNEERIKQIQDIVNSTKTAKEKFEMLYKTDGGDVDKTLLNVYKEAYSKERSGLFTERFTGDVLRANYKVSEGIRKIAKHTRAWIRNEYGGMSKLTEAQVREIDKILEDSFGKEYAVKVRMEINLPVQPGAKNLLTGWKFQAKRILGSLFGELVTEDTSLNDLLDEVSKRRKDATEQLEVYNGSLKSSVKLGDEEKKQIGEEIDKIKLNTKAYDELLKRYGYVEKKSNGEKNIRKERVDNIEREIDVIKKAQEAYEKYLSLILS